MGRIACIDFGLKRIGIALSDERRKIAFPLETVAGGKQAIENIRRALASKPGTVERILVGLPLLMNGQEGEMAQLVRKFASELTTSMGVPVELIDERLSSRLADQHLREIALHRKERTDKMDTAAATLLLQTYLDKHHA